MTQENGFVSIRSNHTVDQTGLHMRPTKLLIFGNPKAGTPLMVALPSAAIDLPLKMLVWEDTEGNRWISYNAPAYLQTRHGFAPELVKNIAVVEVTLGVGLIRAARKME